MNANLRLRGKGDGIRLRATTFAFALVLLSFSFGGFADNGYPRYMTGERFLSECKENSHSCQEYIYGLTEAFLMVSNGYDDQVGKKTVCLPEDLLSNNEAIHLLFLTLAHRWMKEHRDRLATMPRYRIVTEAWSTYFPCR